MPEKKSETLEVRLPYSQKRAFMDACAAEGTTASEEVRGFVGRFLDARAIKPGRNLMMTAKNHPLKVAAGALTLAGVGLAMSANGTSIAGDPDFERLDRDRDGVLTALEIGPNAGPLVAQLDTDGSGTVSEAELLGVGKRASIVSVSATGQDDSDITIQGVRIDYDLAASPVRVSVHERRTSVPADVAEARMKEIEADLYAIESRLGFGTVGPDAGEDAGE